VTIPNTVAGGWPEVKPDRFAARIRHDGPDGCAIALLGLPDDTGVVLNGGRAGAAEGPTAFRAALARFGTPWDGRDHRELAVGVFDAGNVAPAPGDGEAALLETHARVEAAVAAVHAQGLVPVCVGGGHDLSLPAITALARHAGGPVGGINLDAHLDVRARVGSGMPFRRLIDGGWLAPRRFVELGLGRFANDEGDLAWLAAKKAKLVFADEVLARAEVPVAELLDAALDGPGPAFVSIDLDGIDGAQAPGVSAVNPMGLAVRHAAALADAAGAAPGVRHFDVMELCPPHDDGGRTARVAALLFLSFVAGFGRRAS
jgi:formimidoylglutamase